MSEYVGHSSADVEFATLPDSPFAFVVKKELGENIVSSVSWVIYWSCICRC